MALPTNVGYGKVVGRFLLGYADGVDNDLFPDGVPAKGSVFFTPSPAYLKDATASPAPATILPAVVEARLNDEGYVCGPQTSDFSDPGVRLVATDDDQLNPKNWTWKADFRLTDATGTPVPLNSFSFDLPEYKSPDNIVVDLTDKLPVTPSNGTPTIVGPAGPANTLSVSGTTTGSAGSSASVTISGTAPSQSLAFTIPRGDKGEKGDTGNAATVAAGTTTTGNPGTNASVTNSGTTSAAVFNFTIPRGEKGDDGADGADAVWNFTGAYDNGADYEIGDLVTYLGSTYYRLLPPNPGYAPTDTTYWKLIAAKGDQGDEGPEGPEGPQGPQGASIVVKGQVATVGNLPSTGNAVNDAYIVTADGHLYVWNGTIWIDAGNVQGPAGEGVPTGGAANTILKKVSSADYDTAWSNTIDGGTA